MFRALALRWPFLSDEGSTLETLNFTTRIGSTPTFLYFDLYLYSACLRSTLRLLLMHVNRFTPQKVKKKQAFQGGEVNQICIC